jgi:hypothetical protein
VYSHCIFCQSSLGTNEVIGSFPVGRRLAFDPAKGRFWVVCKKCERWNLSPLEERWEAFEECERVFHDARMRMSTDNIGLARLREGLELVRIGNPLRPEFAAWRYGDQFGRRRRRAIIWTAAAAAGVVAVYAGLAAAGVGIGAMGQLPQMLFNLPVRVKIRTKDGRVLKLRRPQLQQTRVVIYPGSEVWSLNVKHSKGREVFEGEEATRVAGLILPKLNYMAGSSKVIRSAVDRIEAAGHPEAFLARLPAAVRAMDAYPKANPKKQGLVHRLPKDMKLALEMALHEEQERLALAGELVDLELQWLAAEEIAAIADNMFVPKEHEEFIERHRPPGAPADGSPPPSP